MFTTAPTVEWRRNRLGQVYQIDGGTEGLTEFENNLDGSIAKETRSGGPLVGTSEVERQFTLGFCTTTTFRLNGVVQAIRSCEPGAFGRLAKVEHTAVNLLGSRKVGAKYFETPGSVAGLTETLRWLHEDQEKFSTTYTYDPQDRLLDASLVRGGTALGVRGYTTNLAGQRNSEKLGDGTRWSYEYDGYGQVESAARKLDGGAEIPGYSFGYQTDGIGTRIRRTRNGRTELAIPNILNQYVSRDVAGIVDVLGRAHAQSTVSVDGTSTVRLGEWFWGTKSVANNTGYPVTATPRVLAVRQFAGPNGEDVTGEVQVSSARIPSHPETSPPADEDGNLLEDGTYRYAWDASNRLREMVRRQPAEAIGGERVEHFYESGSWRRIARRTWSRDPLSGIWLLINDTTFVWDGSLLLAEVDQTPPAEGSVVPRVVRSYAWGRDLSGSLEGAGGVGGLVAVLVHSDASSSSLPSAHFAQADGRGNVVALWDSANGTQTAIYEYGPFGEKLRTSGEMALSNPLRWSSKYDDGNGMVYYGYRYYNPDTGRWLSRDPIGEEGGVNLYGFVENRPISEVDALGLMLTPVALPIPINNGPTDKGHGGETRASWPETIAKAVGRKVVIDGRLGLSVTLPEGTKLDDRGGTDGLTYRQHEGMHVAIHMNWWNNLRNIADPLEGSYRNEKCAKIVEGAANAMLDIVYWSSRAQNFTFDIQQYGSVGGKDRLRALLGKVQEAQNGISAANNKLNQFGNEYCANKCTKAN